ncbi:MAG: DUF1059 domain-containing protein [Hymenobacteraceae bacterium]|nr:DUF1059 domain-containing protein [Hymenobacteraceae bacterium]MDX5481818.1 DUF1059 domain-containing protein [Hymenobacteraceae bacterium]
MKTLKCRDAGFDCKGEIRANTEQQVLQEATRHAREVHGLTDSPDLKAKLKALIKDDGKPC